jgi:N-acetylglucosaminyldiphosphoundecaprenol N-acetyl-beta-D-mannosaminyltransferase
MQTANDSVAIHPDLERMDTNRAEILGVPLSLLARDDVRQALRDLFQQGREDACRHLVTLNPEYVMHARRDQAFRRSLGRADLITADGIGVLLATRLTAGKRADRLERVTGVELVEWLAADSGKMQAPLFLLGAAPGAAAEAALRLRERFPDAQIAGWWGEGRPHPIDDAETITRIAASGARVALVAYGAPGQVLWIERNRDALARAGVVLAIGVGGALDFLAGRTPRAPRFIQRFGFEWLYRLIRQPWRWRRQLALPVFAALVLRDAVRARMRWRSI